MIPTFPVPRRPWHSALRVLVASLALCLFVPASHAAAPTQLADPGDFVYLAVAAMPGDGYLLVWQDPSSLALVSRAVSAAGVPAASDRTLIPSLDFQVRAIKAAYSTSGRLLVLWTQPAGADQIGIAGALFDAGGALVRMLAYDDPIPDPGSLVISEGARVAALPGGGFALVSHTGIQTDPLGDPLVPTDYDIHLRRLGENGLPIGQAVRVHDDSAGLQGSAQVGTSSGGIVVTWHSVNDDAQRIWVRVFDTDLTPASPEILVDQAESLASPGLAVGADGDFLLVWRGLEAPPFDTNAEPRLAIRLQAFDATGDTIGLEQVVERGGANPHVAPSVAMTEQGTIWVSWLAQPVPAPGIPMGTVILAQELGLDGTPLGPVMDVATTDGVPGELTGGDRGALLTWHSSGAPPVILGQVLGPAADIPELPEDLALESPELPGFRVWVRITAGDSFTIWGTETSPCLAEALCVAGAIPDRAELIVRIVGPRANGFLWPTLSRLSTSRIDVWIEQLTTGALQHYVLPGATPGSETLSGLFDREGFEP